MQSDFRSNVPIRLSSLTLIRNNRSDQHSSVLNRLLGGPACAPAQLFPLQLWGFSRGSSASYSQGLTPPGLRGSGGPSERDSRAGRTPTSKRPSRPRTRPAGAGLSPPPSASSRPDRPAPGPAPPPSRALRSRDVLAAGSGFGAPAGGRRRIRDSQEQEASE